MPVPSYVIEVSLSFLATCARLSWILSFRVHVKLCYRIVSYLIRYLYTLTHCHVTVKTQHKV